MLAGQSLVIMGTVEGPVDGSCVHIPTHPPPRPQRPQVCTLWKGSVFPVSKRESVWFLYPHSHSPLASAGVLAPSFCIPLAYCFSNKLFTLVSSSLAAVWAAAGTDMLARQGAVRWARAGCWGKRLRGDEMSSLHLWSDTETSLSEKVGCLFKTGKGGKGSLPVCRGLLGGMLIGSTGWPHPGSPTDPKQDLVPSSLVWCSVLTSWVESSTEAVSP